MNRLQEESGDGEKASEASTRDSKGLASTVADDTAGGGGADGSGGLASANWVGGSGDRVAGSGRVDVGWRADGRANTQVSDIARTRQDERNDLRGAGHGAGGVHWLGDGVGTRGQGHGAGLSQNTSAMIPDCKRSGDSIKLGRAVRRVLVASPYRSRGGVLLTAVTV